MKADSSSVGKPRWRRRLLLASVLSATLLAALPTLLSYSGTVRNWLLGQLAGSKMELTTGSAQLGWLRPLAVGELVAQDRETGTRLTVRGFRAERSWPRLLWSLPQLGKFEIDEPRLDYVATGPADVEPDELTDPSAGGPAVVPQFEASIRDAEFGLRLARDADPVVQLEGVDIHVQVASEAGQPVLSVQPAAVIQSQEMTRSLCNHGLHLIAPMLAEAGYVEGQFSLDIKRCRIPLGRGEPVDLRAVDLEGAVDLRDVRAGLKSPLLREVAELLTKVLGGQPASEIRLVDNTNLHFAVREGRVHHEGLALILPDVSSDIQIRTRGSVGFDETLDLVVEIHIPLTRLHDGPLTRMLANKPFELAVRGTVADPQIGFPDDRSWYANLAKALLPANRAQGDAAEGATASSPAESAADWATTLMETAGRLIEQRRQRRAEAARAEASEGQLEEAETGPQDASGQPVEGERRGGFLKRLRDRRQKRETPDSPRGQRF